MVSRSWTGRAFTTTLLLASLFLVAPVSIVRAQNNGATVTGVISDSTGRVIAGADVTATNTSTGLVTTAQSDQSGRYTILHVDAGTYDVRTSHAGFSTVLRHDQPFLVGQTVTLDVTMQVASIAQTVEVQAESTTVIPTTESVVERVVEPTEVDNLPTVNRAFSDLAALSPGVLVATTTGNPSGLGASGASITVGDGTSYQTGYIVDGTSTEENFAGGQYLNFAQDWIQEFSLISEQPPAEYGSASAGFVNAITKSGGNNVHGRAYGFFQNAALNASPLFLPAAAPNKPPYNLERVGGFIGGPIKKDKLFYFGGYELYHLLNSVPVNVPAAFVAPESTSGAYGQPSTTHIAMVKMDYQINADNKLAGRFNYQYGNNALSGLGGAPVSTLGHTTNNIQPTYSINGRWLRTLSPTQLNEVLVGVNLQTTSTTCTYANSVGPYPLYPSQPGSTIGGNPQGWWSQQTYSNAPPSGVITGCPANFGLGLDQAFRDANLSDNFSVTRGNHDIKVGAQAALEEQKLYLVRNGYDGEYTFSSTVPFSPTTIATYPLSIVLTPSGGEGQHGSVFGYNFSFFGQDSWKITPSLTLNIGLRYYVDFLNSWMAHHYDLPQLNKPIVPEYAVNNDYGDIAPRFGFAWTPFHDSGRTVIRGGLGVFYDQNHDGYYAVTYGNGIKVQNAFNLNATRPSLNPYCLGYVSCPTSVPSTTIGSQTYQGATKPLTPSQAVEDILAYALATYQNPNFTAGTYTIPGGATFTIPTPTLGPPATPGGTGTGGLAPINGGANNIDQNLKNPGEIQVSAGVGHEFTNHLSASADFVYIRGFQLIIIRNTNISMSGSLVNPAYGSINSYGNGGRFIDKSLRVKTSYRDRRGDSMLLAYTLGWANDDTAGNFGSAASTTLATDPFNYMVDWGPSVNDARHILNFSSTLQGPWGVQLSPILQYNSALPYNPTTTALGICPAYYNQCYPDIPGTSTPYTKNALRGGDIIMANARLSKSIRLGESRSLLFLIEGYNIPNIANYGKNYNGSVTSSAFMKPTALATNMRQLQVGFRFDF